MAQPDLDGLIIEHLGDIDQAVVRTQGIETEIFTAMGEVAEKWAREVGWTSDFAYPEEGWGGWNRWVAPPEWRTEGTPKDEKEFDAWFQLGVGAEDTESGTEGEDWFYLTRLCGAGSGQMGFRFDRHGIVKPRQWKQNFSRLVGIVSPTPFQADTKPSFFLPFVLSRDVLSEALRNEDPNSALRPFTDALNALLTAKPVFDKLVEYSRSGEIAAAPAR